MKKTKFFANNSFKKKLTIAFLVIGLLPLILISIIYQNILNNRISTDSETASIEKLRYMSLNIERQIEISEQLLGWITYNQRLENILTKSYENNYDKQLDIIEFSSYVMEYAVNANIESNIFKILIVEEDGSSFQMGNSYSLLDKDSLINAGWMENYHRRQADQLIPAKDIYVKNASIFPMSSRIYNNSTGRPIGWCLVTFQNDLYSKCLISGSRQENIFLLNKGGQCIGHVSQELVGTNLSNDPLIRQILDSQDTTGHVTGKYGGVPSILHYYRIPSTDLVAVQCTSLEAFLLEKRKMTRLSILFILSTMAVILLVILYLRGKLIRPLNIISDYIKRVPDSGFKGNMVLEGDDEFKKIASSINTMELEIRDLIEARQREADIKKELEFKVLQNQINPHFLYNTLNSIKWMATLQHADTIRDMTAALGRLLKNISKGTADRIPIYEEMSLLDDYILIQDIRYNGKIKVEYRIGDGQITQAYIIKFLLQPIVENAIFHGIEPKDGCGTITIYLEKQEEDIVIRILDDGIGMTQKQIDALLEPGTGQENLRGLNGVGISNIHERIIMTYGRGYGISITSEPGIYTSVTLRIPYEKEG